MTKKQLKNIIIECQCEIEEEQDIGETIDEVYGVKSAAGGVFKIINRGTGKVLSRTFKSKDAAMKFVKSMGGKVGDKAKSVKNSRGAKSLGDKAKYVKDNPKTFAKKVYRKNGVSKAVGSASEKVKATKHIATHNMDDTPKDMSKLKSAGEYVALGGGVAGGIKATQAVGDKINPKGKKKREADEARTSYWMKKHKAAKTKEEKAEINKQWNAELAKAKNKTNENIEINEEDLNELDPNDIRKTASDKTSAIRKSGSEKIAKARESLKNANTPEGKANARKRVSDVGKSIRDQTSNAKKSASDKIANARKTGAKQTAKNVGSNVSSRAKSAGSAVKNSNAVKGTTATANRAIAKHGPSVKRATDSVRNSSAVKGTTASTKAKAAGAVGVGIGAAALIAKKLRDKKRKDESMDVLKTVIRETLDELMETRQLNEIGVGYTVKAAGKGFVLVSKKTGNALKQVYASRQSALNAIKAMGSVVKSTAKNLQSKASIAVKKVKMAPGAKGRKDVAKVDFRKAKSAKTRRINKSRKAGKEFDAKATIRKKVGDDHIAKQPDWAGRQDAKRVVKNLNKDANKNALEKKARYGGYR